MTHWFLVIVDVPSVVSDSEPAADIACCNLLILDIAVVAVAEYFLCTSWCYLLLHATTSAFKVTAQQEVAGSFLLSGALYC